MVAGIRVYIEGGGSDGQTKRQLREGFHRFFSEPLARARSQRLSFQLILCGDAHATYRNFCRALDDHADSLNLLLVDADHPVAAKPWEHLGTCLAMLRPNLVEDDQCHLMVQVMESWFLADPERFAEFYGLDGLHSIANDVEAVAKEQVYRTLKDATRKSSKGEYHKIRHASHLLQQIRPERVRAASKHGDRLFKTLESHLSRG